MLSRDDRFILKQMSRFEFQSFTEFAPHYFKYIKQCKGEKIPFIMSSSSLKGTVSVVSSDPLHANIQMPNSQWNPWNFNLINNAEDIVVFKVYKWLFMKIPLCFAVVEMRK